MPLHPDHERDLGRLNAIARRMDYAFRIPFVGVRLGWDSILGIVPGIGDALALAPAGYIVKEAHRMGASNSVLARMGANIGIDFFIGTVPLIGDLFDVAWKANSRNVALLHDHLEKRPAVARAKTEIEGKLSSHHPTLRG